MLSSKKKKRKSLFYHFIEWIYLRLEGNLAYYDDMTGLPNRQYYNRVMKTRYLGKEVYVYYIDVDNLKETNDTLGHAAGSALIKFVAKQLFNLKENGKLIEVARIGGDEFVAISKEFFDMTIEKASVGKEHKEVFEDVSSAIHKADEKMYAVKAEHHKSD